MRVYMNTILNDTTIELARAKLPARGLSEPFAEEAQWILREHEMAAYDDKVSLDRKIAIGAELVRIKAEIKKAGDDWIPWTRRNLRGISHRSINRYMAIYRRHKEPLALEDPGAFLAQIYGNTTEEEENDDAFAAAPPPNSTLTSNLSADGKKSPPKRTRRAAKAKTKATTPPATNAPTTSTTTTAPTTATVSDRDPEPPLSFDLASEHAIEEIEETVCDWRERFGNRLLEHPEVTPRVAEDIERLLADFDLALDALTLGLRDAAREVAS
jgi:hypothetical protein